jgi:hypothetical protein
MGREFSTPGKKKKKNEYRILVGKPEGKRPLGRPRGRQMIILQLIFERLDGDGMDWIYLALDRDQWRSLVNTVVNLRSP